jgi:hypothetical protein
MPHTSSKDLASITALELSNALQTHPLQRCSVTLEQRNSKECTNYQIFSQRPFRPELHNMHPQWLRPPNNSGLLSHLSIAQRYPPACKSLLYHKLQAILHALSGIHLRG